MAPVKRRPHTRSQHRTKSRRRKLNIPELVYKFLSANEKNRGNVAHSCTDVNYRFSTQQKRQRDVLDSADSRRTNGRNMANKHRKDGTRNPKSSGLKRRRGARDHTLSSCVHKCRGGEGLQKVKKYIQTALDFGVESGYLIPRDPAYRILRVSSDLLNNGSNNNKVRSASQEKTKNLRRTPSRFEDYAVQEARRRKGRRRRRRRSRSRSRRRRSRRRGRRRSSSQNPEEAAENDTYELKDKNEKKNSDTMDTDRNPENTQMRPSNGEKAMAKRKDDDSDLSIDEDETDEEGEKKREDETKS